MTDDTQQPKPEIVPLMTVGLENFADVVRWIAEPEDPEVRKERAAAAKEAVAEALGKVDHQKFNKALRDEARRLTRGDPR
jgi:hypothetical protein